MSAIISSYKDKLFCIAHCGCLDEESKDKMSIYHKGVLCQEISSGDYIFQDKELDLKNSDVVIPEGFQIVTFRKRKEASKFIKTQFKGYKRESIPVKNSLGEETRQKEVIYTCEGYANLKIVNKKSLYGFLSTMIGFLSFDFSTINSNNRTYSEDISSAMQRMLALESYLQTRDVEREALREEQ